ncbi:MAG: nucleoside deaminase [Candidatus Omnitrophota bacterium]
MRVVNKDSGEKFMLSAIAKAKQGIKNGQSPFGACIIRRGVVISCAHNLVWKNTDITAHAEICAIRDACKKLNSVDLSGCVIYSTCEPCPMCFSAIHWARIKEIIYGVGIKDAKRFGFNELSVSNKRLKEIGRSRIKINGGFLREENLGLFEHWASIEGKRVY